MPPRSAVPTPDLAEGATSDDSEYLRCLPHLPQRPLKDVADVVDLLGGEAVWGGCGKEWQCSRARQTPSPGSPPP